MKITFSVNNIPIRLSQERIRHISNRHPEMLQDDRRIVETIGTPDLVQQGDVGTLCNKKI